MNIDQFILAHSPAWNRLDELSARCAGRTTNLSPDDLDELVALYQRSSSHLAHARTAYDDAALIGRLSRTVGAARTVIYARRSRPTTAVRSFLVSAFPGAVWQQRRLLVVAALFTFVPAVGMGIWLANSPRALAVDVPIEQQQLIAEHEFADYYSSDSAGAFAAHVVTNNILVGFQAFAFGIFGGVLTAYVLLLNGYSIGVMAAVMHARGAADVFWGLITPHGLLELTAVVIAGGAGLRLGWALMVPGERTRSEALAEEGQRSVVVVLGLALCFLVAGVIEAFVTPSGMPTALRIMVGVSVEVAFVSYVWVLGRRAEAAGITGLLRDRPFSWDDEGARLDAELASIPGLHPRRAPTEPSGAGGAPSSGTDLLAGPAGRLRAAPWTSN